MIIELQYMFADSSCMPILLKSGHFISPFAQCQDVNVKCERVIKLQHVLNSFILKARDPSDRKAEVRFLYCYQKSNSLYKMLWLKGKTENRLKSDKTQQEKTPLGL